MTDWGALDFHEWKEEARKEQQYFCDSLGDRDYDAYQFNEVKYLDLKIGNAVYGPPKNVDENQNEVGLENYEEDQQKHIGQIRNLILSKTGEFNVRVAFIFLSIKQNSKQYPLPLIRILSSQDEELFVDHEVRLYKGWQDFLSNNVYPECLYCYPTDGVYRTGDNNEVLLSYGESPSCSWESRAVQKADTLSTLATVGSLGMMVGAFFCPPAAPFLLTGATWAGVGSGTYAVGRSALRLNDRKNHEQSINPFSDAEARGYWISFVGGAFSVGSMGLLKYTSNLARNGEVARRAVRVAFNCFEGGNLTVSGLGILSHAYELCNKKEKLTVQEVVGFSTSILFFTHSCVSLKSANRIIEEVQASVLTGTEASLPAKQRRNFQKLVKDSVGENRIQGNAKVIKSLQHIDDLEGFVKKTATVRCQARKQNIKFAEGGLISINDQLNIDPRKMASINSVSQKKILEGTKMLNSNPAYRKQFLLDMNEICRQERIQFEVTRKETVAKMRDLLGVKDLGDFKFKGKNIFKNLQPHQIDRIGNVMKHGGHSYDKELFEVVQEMASKNDCCDVNDFCSYVEFVNKFLCKEGANYESLPKKRQFAVALAELKNPDSGKMEELLSRFTELRREVSGVNATASHAFASDNLATYHFYKHRDQLGSELTATEYFDMIEDHFQNVDLPRNSILSQDGNVVYIDIRNPSSGVRGIKIRPVDGSKNSVFVATFMYNECM